MAEWQYVAWAQAGYFVLTGVWPIVHVRSFMAVTGPKRDVWLVRTLGALISAVGASITTGALRGGANPSPELLTLAIGSAAALGAADVVYVARGTIARIYLADAVAEAVLIGAWVWAAWAGR
ncbi:MAG TPA: hypothetical protein VEA69_13265 [Tepidisphaeraceae bacterium]|nr:hypothetical protein [Tepidisphaeraceae bacterium]